MLGTILCFFTLLFEKDSYTFSYQVPKMAPKNIILPIKDVEYISSPEQPPNISEITSYNKRQRISTSSPIVLLKK